MRVGGSQLYRGSKNDLLSVERRMGAAGVAVVAAAGAVEEAAVPGEENPKIRSGCL
jgi:hypothetical protein